MADNIAVSEGSGKSVRTDDVGGQQVQIIKMAIGGDGVAADVVAGAGAVSTGVQRVTLASDDPAVASLAAIDAGTPAALGQATMANSMPVVIASNQTAVPVSLAAAAAAIAKAEDVASADADVGVPAMAVRKATPANTSGTDGDYEMLQMSAGRLWTSAVLEASEAFVGHTGGVIINPSANFTRPADTNAYTSGDLVANNTTAGSVVALSWTAARIAAGNFFLRRARVRKSTTGVTNASFRLHIYAADPTAASGISNGDNGVWLTKVAGYMGSLDIVVDKAFSDGAQGHGAPNIGGEVNVALASGSTLYGLLEARGAYTPGNAEVFTVDLELWQN